MFIQRVINIFLGVLLTTQVVFAADSSTDSSVNEVARPAISPVNGAVDPESDLENMTVKDPYESFNRGIFNFNEALDKAILKPVASVYNVILPPPVRKGVSNFFDNLNMVPTILNDLLQANFYQATSDTWRLGINSTVGLLGFVDVASKIGLEPNAEDFGLTLAQWGYTNSNYLVLPFFGPSTVRDGIGLPINYEFLSVYPYIHPMWKRYALYGLWVVSTRATLLNFEKISQQITFDKYVFQRDAYMQRRAYLIQRNHELGNPYLSETTEPPQPTHKFRRYL